MTDLRRTMTFGNLWAKFDDAWALFRDGVIHEARWGAHDDPVEMKIEIEGTAQAYYVRDGWGGPDGYTPMMIDFRVNGTTISPNEIERVLAICGPADRVAKVREVVDAINKRQEEAERRAALPRTVDVRPIGPKDNHVWRGLTEEEQEHNYVPDPHSSQIICERCHMEICEPCGDDDPGYSPICAAPGQTFPPR